MSIYDNAVEGDWDFERQLWCRGRKHNLPVGPAHPHYPNKSEAKKLRQIMATTGLTEEAVRANVVYRRQLATAQKAPQAATPNNHRREYEIKQQRRRDAFNLGVPVWQVKV